jgi:hypothetical protein
LRGRLLYALIIGATVMVAVPTDIRLVWQWAIGFIAAFALASIAAPLKKRIVRVALIAAACAVANAGLSFIYKPDLPADVGSAAVTFSTSIDSTRILVQFLLAVLIAFGVDFFLVPPRKTS